MRLNSLVFRLIVASAAWALMVLPIAAFYLNSYLRSEVERRFNDRLRLLVFELVADSTEIGGPEPRRPTVTGERNFTTLFSGWYWQVKRIEPEPEVRFVSESLTTEDLKLPSALGKQPDRDGIRWADAIGPVERQPLRVAEVHQVLGDPDNPRTYSFAVSGHLGEIQAEVGNFANRLAFAVAFLALSLVVATLLQAHYGLQPLRSIGRKLAAIRSGETASLDGRLPAEIEPLQVELNALIKSNQDVVERARTHVGNLAHALKTPLAVIINEARDDKGPLAAKVAEQAEIMRHQINHYLDRARMAARVGVIGQVTEVKPVAEALVRTLSKIYSEKQLEMGLDCAEDAKFQGERQDLEEMLGNLLDNACKWAAKRVTLAVGLLPVDASAPIRRLELLIEDDGPGLGEADLAKPVQRGRRLDETKPGSGLGHSIIADLAHSYRGEFTLYRAKLGGLGARIVLPAA